MNIQNNFSVNVNGIILDLSTPCVMSIINITPDSFWSGSRNTTEKEIIVSVEKAITDGTSILDIGGYSTRPGANEVTEREETQRI
ncbi:MAG: dihydropteroate synthase, partial [Rikenellaceae bacterium]